MVNPLHIWMIAMFVRRPILHQETLSPRRPHHPYRNLCHNSYRCSLLEKTVVFQIRYLFVKIRSYHYRPTENGSSVMINFHAVCLI